MVNVPFWPSELVTTTLTAPAECTAVVAEIDVLLITVTPVAAVPPRLTVAPARNPVPVIVTAVPPLAIPEVGEMALTVGAGFDDPTVRLTAAECCSEPEWAVMEMEFVPCGVLAAVVTVRVAVAGPAIGFTQAEPNEQFAPAGKPEHVNETARLKPFSEVTRTS